MEESQKKSKVIQYTKSSTKPSMKTTRAKIKKTVDLDNSNDETELLNFEKPSIYDQAMSSISKTSPQKLKKMKIL